MDRKKISGYLINRFTGTTIGVNHFGLLVAEGYVLEKSVCEIAELWQTRKNHLSVRAESFEGLISDFIKQMKSKGFKRSNLVVVSLDKFSVNPPLIVQLDLSWDCNLKCRHCYLVDTEMKEVPLSKKEWKKIIDDLSEMGVPKIVFLGGEPLIAPNFFELAFYAFQKGFKLYTTSNCVLITPKIARDLVGVGFNEIDVSLDGANYDSHEFIRGNGTFDTTIRGIKTLVNTGIKVKSATVVSKRNLKELSELIELGERLKLHHMYFNALIATGDHENSLRTYELNGDDWFYAKGVMEKWNKQKKHPRVFAENWFVFENINSRKGQNIDIFEYAGCKAGKREFIITPDGFVVACPLLSTKREFQTMNVRDYTLSYIWERDEWIKRLREVNEDTIKGKCKRCLHKNVCKGGCHILSLFRSDDINCPDPRCPLTI